MLVLDADPRKTFNNVVKGAEGYNIINEGKSEYTMVDRQRTEIIARAGIDVNNSVEGNMIKVSLKPVIRL